MGNALTIRLISIAFDGPVIAARWAVRYGTRQQLRRLDTRALADVGISEAERRRECSKWFWES